MYKYKIRALNQADRANFGNLGLSAAGLHGTESRADARTPIDFAVGDVNNDGRMDVVVASASTTPGVQGVDVFLGAGTALSVIQGSPQNTAIGTAFPSQLEVHAGLGAVVTFSAPSSGPGAAFGAAESILSVRADGLGNAEAPVLTANSHVGTYTVTVGEGVVAGEFYPDQRRRPPRHGRRGNHFRSIHGNQHRLWKPAAGHRAGRRRQSGPERHRYFHGSRQRRERNISGWSFDSDRHDRRFGYRDITGTGGQRHDRRFFYLRRRERGRIVRNFLDDKLACRAGLADEFPQRAGLLQYRNRFHNDHGRWKTL